MTLVSEKDVRDELAHVRFETKFSFSFSFGNVCVPVKCERQCILVLARVKNHFSVSNGEIQGPNNDNFMGCFLD